MADANGALLAFLGLLIGGYVNNFLAEDFRRFRDSQALAAGLAGELESHAEAIPFIKIGLLKMQEAAESGATLSMPEWPVPNSPIFEANAEKIGLLHPDHANGVAYVYEQIRAFRNALHQLSKHPTVMNGEWNLAMVNSCLTSINRAEDRGVPLVDGLKRRAEESYWRRPETRYQCITAALFVFSFLFGVSYFHRSVPTEAGTNCITTLDHGALHTTCK